MRKYLASLLILQAVSHSIASLPALAEGESTQALPFGAGLQSLYEATSVSVAPDVLESKISATLPSDVITASTTSSSPSPSATSDNGETPTFSRQYTELTKKILLEGISLERFSLNFRTAAAKQPKFRRLRYFVCQEAGAAGGLAFEATGADEFRKGRRHPLQINNGSLRTALATTMTTSIVAGSGSAIELGSNLVQSWKNHQNGYDPHSATKTVSSKLKEIDSLLADRERIVEANRSHPAYASAVAEGRVLRAMRSSFVNEYAHFNADTRSYIAYQNLFYFLNASYNTVGAIAADTAYRGTTRTHLNGTANVLFIVSGGLATVTPLLSAAVGKMVRGHAYDSLERQLGHTEFDRNELEDACKKWDALGHATEGTLMPALPATQRLAVYTQSQGLFEQQLENETKIMRKLEKVALQSSILGPAIGSTLMTQGILGTYGYYNYPIRLRKQLNRFYYGSVVGTVGTSAAVVGNIASLLSGMSYEHKLSKEKRLPRQLIQGRLEHLDQLEKTVLAL